MKQLALKWTNGIRAREVALRYGQPLLLLLSATCIAGMFYITRTPAVVDEVAPVAAPASPGNKDKDTPPPSENGVNGVASVSTIATDALAFKALCTTTEQASLQLTYSTSLARKWSNLPCAATCRNGVQFGAMTGAKYSAAMQIIRDALSVAANEGYSENYQIALAEAYLHVNGGGNMWDSTLRWMAFLNTPSATGAWMLQFGGHHYAANIAFNNGHVIGATPFFMGVEPISFTYGGNSYTPLNTEHDGFANMLAGLTSAQLATAKLNTTFGDCYMIPGETNNHNYTGFPATKVGIPCSSLSTAQKNLVLATIDNYTNDMDSATHASMQALYASEINNTYIAYTGSGTASNASSFLIAQNDYARIDGPHVWAEFFVSNLSVIAGALHYHTVWRDHIYDYGVDLTNITPLDQPLVLPLKLLSFAVNKTGSAPVVSWITADERNMSHFEVEQSINPTKDYKKLGNIQAKNASGESRYSYLVTEPLTAAVTYFRLKMIDVDGKISYSSIAAISSTFDNLKVVNTVVNSELVITHAAAITTGYYRITNMQGQVITKGQITAGTTSTIINVGILAKGQYVVAVERGGDKLTTKILKK